LSSTKLKALKHGSTLAVISPASLANAETVARGVAALEQQGFRVKVMPHALDRGPLNFAGAVAERVGDLHAAYADVEVEAILCTRGGWGCAELLPLLDRELIAANPKPLIGYSDLTTLHVWLRREFGRACFQGPMVASDFSKDVPPHRESWTSALMRDEPWSLTVETGLRMLKPGVAEGVFTGGCLSIYVEAIGTPYAPKPEGGVLFLEDVGTKSWQWDRQLLHLQYAGLMEGVTGIVFGDMTSCGDAEEAARIEAAILHSLRDFDGPVAIGLRSGHVEGGNVTLPFGVRVRLDLQDAANPRMDFLEGSVER
jgi:muramoyltetrapeptide carboxypeptidase